MRARKRFGQNFLIDKNIVRKIVTAINPLEEHIVEIGPGTGVLTEELVKLSAHLQAIEIDRDLISLLEQKFSDEIVTHKLVIHQADVLEFDFSRLATDAPVTIVGNLPYNISTPLMFKLLEYSNRIKNMFFMLQLEVVERICAQPSSHDYGRLSIMTNYYSTSKKLFNVPANSFTPAPKVNSAFIQITPRPGVKKDSRAMLLHEIVASAFSKRRKTLRNALSGFLSDDDFSELQLNPKLRPENLSLDDYLACVDQIQMNRSKTS